MRNYSSDRETPTQAAATESKVRHLHHLNDIGMQHLFMPCGSFVEVVRLRAVDVNLLPRYAAVWTLFSLQKHEYRFGF